MKHVCNTLIPISFITHAIRSVNIHTHLMPFIMWSFSLIPFVNSSAFTAFALVCLFSSVLWHTMSGCAHPVGMELCARVDYVGIGWYVEFFFFDPCGANSTIYRLISASVGTVVYYGFQCYPHVGQIFLVSCLPTGIAGNVFPFMDWFNQYEYRASNPYRHHAMAAPPETER